MSRAHPPPSVAVTAAEQRAAQWECHKVVTRFYRLLDALDYDAVAEMFQPDGCWLRKGVELRTRENILSALVNSPLRTPTLVSHHLIANMTFDVDSPRAVRFSAYVISLKGDSAMAQPGHVSPLGAQSTHLCRGESRKTDQGWRMHFYTPGLAMLLIDLPNSGLGVPRP